MPWSHFREVVATGIVAAVGKIERRGGRAGETDGSCVLVAGLWRPGPVMAELLSPDSRPENCWSPVGSHQDDPGLPTSRPHVCRVSQWPSQAVTRRDS